MEEKKLTDEEIVKALENCNNGLTDMNRHSCDTCPYREIESCGKAQMTDCLDLIHRLQAEIERLAKVEMDLISKIADKSAEIERLTEEIDQRREMMHRMDCNYATELHKNAELQKQVDELEEENEKAYEIERANIQAEIAEAGTSCHWCKAKTEKDTAKDILTDLSEYYYDALDNTDCAARFDFWCRKYDVEVE